MLTPTLDWSTLESVENALPITLLIIAIQFAFGLAVNLIDLFRLNLSVFNAVKMVCARDLPET